MCVTCEEAGAIGLIASLRICVGFLQILFGCGVIGVMIGWKIQLSLTGLVARYVILAMEGTLLVVARMSQVPCNA